MVWGLFPVDPLSGEDKYYIFSSGNYKIGRKGCDIIINKDKGVSRIHAELTYDATTAVSTTRRSKASVTSSCVIRVKDCSKYGTFIKTDLDTKEKVHELPNKEKILKDGDVITFGTGLAIYRLSLVPLVFYFCPSSETFKVDRLVQDTVSSIGARVAPTLTEECTHVLLEPHMQVNEALVNAILAKKPIVLMNWVNLLAEKSIRSEFPGYTQYRPSVIVEESLVDVVELNVREKCLEGYTFVLEPLETYRFGCSFTSLLKLCGAETVAISEISSMSQDSQYGNINRMICVIPKSSGDKFGRLKHLSLLSRVNELDLLCAILCGNLPSTSLIPPSVVISSSCSTDETVVADSETEEEETTSVHMIDATEKAETPERAAAIVIEDSPVTILEETENLTELKSVNVLTDSENRGDIDEKKPCYSVPDMTIRKDRNDEPEAGNSEIIYTQDLIVRDLRLIRNVRSTGEEVVVNFKRFRKGNVTSGNSFSNLIPFAKDPYKEYESGGENVTDFMKEEKRRKQMEAVAEDLFNTEKARKRGTTGSIRGFLSRA